MKRLSFGESWVSSGLFMDCKKNRIFF